MTTTQIAMVIVAAVAACACVGGAVVLLDDSGSEDSGSKDSGSEDSGSKDRGTYYFVTYVLNGGTNSDKNPDGFYVGDDGTLYSPTREGYLFNGWCSDADLENYVGKIDTSSEGDVTLYASWVEIYAGKGYTLTYTSKTSMPFSPDAAGSGTLSHSYLYYDEEMGFYYTSVTTANGQTTTESKWSSENDNSGYTLTYEGVEECESTYYGKSVKCEVYKFTSNDYTETQTQYIYGGWIPVKIDVEYKSMFYTYVATYVLSDVFDVDKAAIDKTYSVDVYNDVGITTTGSGTYDAVSDVTLTASVSEGYEFGGWYDADGNLLSSESAYTVSKILSDRIVFASNTKSPDYNVTAGTSFTLKAVSGASSVTWTVTDSSGNEATVTDAAYTFPGAGEYNVTYSCRYGDADYFGYYTVLADGTVSKVFAWKYDSDGDGTKEDYSYTLNILYSDYIGYVNRDCSRQSGTEDEDRAYVTSDDKYVRELAEYFTGKTNGWTDYNRMSFVLAFTQYIEYVSDTESEGTEEYWKFPLETLFEQNGDCEDTSILFCAIASAMHYKSAMLLFYGHMAAGVELPDGSISKNSKAGDPFPEGGVNYYYCETTSTEYTERTSLWSSTPVPFTAGTVPSGYEYEGTYYNYGNMGDIIPVDPVSA